MRVSLVIPTLNGIRTLPALFDALDGQVGARLDEIVAVDSGSTDGTAQWLRARGATVEAIPRRGFNHGETRNLAIGRTRGDLVVLIVQDARPAGPGWLAALVAPLAADDSVAGSFARQVPVPGASALTRWSLEGWAGAHPASRTVGPFTADAFAAMAPPDRHNVCVFDNVCSCVRRAAWERHQFARATIAEDLEWARDVLLDGWRIAYAADAVVEHSHDRGAVYEWRRTYLVHRRLQELFGLSTIPTAGTLLSSIVRTIPAHLRAGGTELLSPRALARAAALAVAWPAGQYFGARSARRGAPPRTYAGV